MAAVADDDQAHRDRLRRENMRRLRVLELRKARQGDATDPAVLTEMEEIRATLATLDMAEAPTPAPEATAHLRSRFVDEFEFWIAQLAALTMRQTRTEDRVGTLETKVDQADQVSAAWRSEHAATHEASNLDRIWGQRRNFWLLIAILVLIAIVAARYVGG